MVVLLLCVSIALVGGLLMTRLMNVFRLPDVTAYLIAGVILGSCVLGKLEISSLTGGSLDILNTLSPISDVALGFIAFAIGSEFRLSHLRTTGGATVTIGIFQAVVTTLLVDAVLLVLHLFLGDMLPISVAITLGAIASATAPAATLMVVRQYKAKGPVTDMLLPVVALDDAVGLVIFAVSFGVAQAITSSSVSLGTILAVPLLEIAFSLIMGAFLGICLIVLECWFHSNRNRVGLITGFIILAVALSMLKLPIFGMDIGFSPLLVCMMLGTIFCNLCPNSADLMERADKWSAPLLTIFFVLSGAELNLSVLSHASVVGIGMTYILIRATGKYLGTWLSSRATHCEPTVQKYLGLTLLPQAGVALGMSAEAGAALGAEGDMIRNVVLFGVLVYELVGPTLTKIALTKAGDIQLFERKPFSHRAFR